MPFYLGSENISRQRWIVAAKLISGGILLIVLMSFFGRQKTQEEIESIISNSPNLQKVDDFCTNLPKPPESELLWKTIGGNSFTTSINYHYRIPKKSKEVNEFYDKIFNDKGWVYRDYHYETIDRKQSVTVLLTDASVPRYSFDCSEISK